MNETLGTMPPPDGVTPQFHGPFTDKQKQIFSAAVADVTLSTVFIALRLYTRGGIVGSFGMDDYAAVVAWAFAVAFAALTFPAIHRGFAQHLYNLTATEIEFYLEILAPISIIYVWAVAMPKISLLLLYHRLSADRLFRIMIYIMGFIVSSYIISLTAVISAGCSPTDSSKGGCLNTLGFSGAIINICSDGLVMLLPLPLVWSLQLPVRQKIALGLLFVGGSFVIVASIIRVRFAQDLQGKRDFTFAQGDIGVWSHIEIMIGIICLSLVVMKPFFHKYLRGLLGSSADGSRNSPFSFNIGSVFSRFKKTQREPRSYRLTSLDRSTRHAERSVQVPPQSITVSHTYEVSETRGDFDSESTEDMMKDGGRGRLGKGLV